jgi:hypothetical protein
VIFALTGSAIIELNGPQVAYFAGRLDKPGYLRQALATYSSLEFLGNVTVPGDTVASIGNCSTAYAPAGIHYESSCRDKDPLPWVVQGLSCQPFRFLILADQDRGRSIKEMLSVRRAMKQIYDDGRFSVYEVAQASACD